jgi:ATP-dependent RNA helicase DeaD
MPGEIRKIVKKYMDAPIEVAVNTEEKINKDIAHKFVTTKPSNKIPALRRFLDLHPDMRGILFCRTKRETQKISDDLGNLGYGVEALHGDLSQGQRDAVMKRFRKRSMQLLIATDVAARGIDVDELTHVLHHTLPDQLDSYTHRSGRTARAGKKGVSLVFINPGDRRKLEELERKKQIKFERIDVPSIEELKSSRINNWANLIINTKVDEQAEEILQDLHGQFAHLSKEALLKRLITTQLDHLLQQGGAEGDLNEAYGRSPSEKRKNHDYHRYFINVGTIDGMTKADLIHFLSDISGIKRKFFGELTLQKNCAYFEVDKGHDRGISNHFAGIEIEGRSIRVNRDDAGNKKVQLSTPRKKIRNNSQKRKKDFRKSRFIKR